MISALAYEAGGQAAWATFMKFAAGPLVPRPALKPRASGMYTVGGGVAPNMPQGGTVVARPSAMAAPGGTRTGVLPGAQAAQAAAAPAPVAPAAAAPAPAPAAAAPAAPAAPAAGGFMQSLKEQAPGVLLSTGLMTALPMAMNAFSGSGNQQQG